MIYSNKKWVCNVLDMGAILYFKISQTTYIIDVRDRLNIALYG